MRKTNLKIGLLAGVLGAFSIAPSTASALSLPTVTNCGFDAPNNNLMCATTSTGAKVYVASTHDDFISYSINALEQLSSFGYTEFSEWAKLPSYGSGQIVKLFTFNNSNNGDLLPDSTGGTGDNQATSPDGDQTVKNDGLYLGEWPFNAVVTVAALKTFLGTGNYSPVFAFDLNNGGLLSLNGEFIIGTDVVRNAAGEIISIVPSETFAFDNVFNDKYDDASFVDAQPKVTVQWVDPLNPKCDAVTKVCTMNVDNNVGSGAVDFFAYAPALDLRNYKDTDELYFQLRMRGLDSGGEELALVSFINVPVKTVPEPGVLGLLGLGLFGLGWMRRNAARKAA